LTHNPIVESGSYQSDPQPIMLGIESGLTNQVSGSIQDFRYYNRVLSQNEIIALYNNQYGIKLKTDDETNHGFIEGDLIRAQRFSGSNVYQSDAVVTRADNDLKTWYVEPLSQDLPMKDYEYVRIGNAFNNTRQGAVYMTSDDDNAPYIDIIDGIDSFTTFQSAGTQKVRLGKLLGITDASLGLQSSDIYGLYTEAGYFKGNIIVGGNVNTASIAEGTIGIGRIIGNANKSIRLSLNDTLEDSGLFAYNEVGDNTVRLVLSGSSRIAGYYIDGNNLWSGNESISNSGTKIVLSSDYQKIALGGTADNITLSSSTGILLSGSGEFLFAKDLNNYIKSTSESIEIKSTNVTLSSSNVNINTPNFYLGGADNYISGSGGNIRIKSTNEFELSSSNVQISSSLFRLKLIFW